MLATPKSLRSLVRSLAVVGALTVSAASTIVVGGAAPAGAASADVAAAERAITAYFTADAAADWPAAVKVSSGLANARVRYFALQEDTVDIPENFLVAPLGDAEISVTVDKVVPKGKIATVEGSAVVSGTDTLLNGSTQRFTDTYTDIRLTRRGKQWLVDSFVRDGSPTLAETYMTGTQRGTSGPLQVRFEVGRNYADPGAKTVTNAAWALVVRNSAKSGDATFESLTVRAMGGKTYTVAVVTSAAGPGVQYSGDQSSVLPKLGFGTADSIAAGEEQPLWVTTPPGAFDGGALEVVYEVAGKPVTVRLSVPTPPSIPGYTAAS